MPRRRPGVLLPLELKILDAGTLLQASEGSFYGFGVAREIADSEQAALIGHGTLYKALNRMAAAGLLEAEWEDAATAERENRPRRRLYRVTAEGAQALASQARAVPASAPRLGIA